MMKIKILFVCMGNICRSPTAHGVFEHLVREAGYLDQIEVDSAGTHAYHVGERPDGRAQQTASNRGINLSYITARRVHENDFEYYDYILAMDQDNLANLMRICPGGYQEKVRLFMDFASNHPAREVPDPYYGGKQGFENVFDMVEAASQGLLDELLLRLK